MNVYVAVFAHTHTRGDDKVVAHLSAYVYMSLRRCFLWARASSALMNSVPGEKFVPPLVHGVSRSPALYSYFAQHFSSFLFPPCLQGCDAENWLNHCAVLIHTVELSLLPVHFFFCCWGIPHYPACIFLLFPFIFEQQQTHYYVRVNRGGSWHSASS
jgi:hypothetical protein